MPRLTALMRRRSGFTLAEVVVTLLILGIVGGAIFKVLVKQQQSYNDTRKQADMQREIRLTSSYLPGDLRSLSSAGGASGRNWSLLVMANGVTSTQCGCRPGALAGGVGRHSPGSVPPR